MNVDSHQHFWAPARGDYFWMEGKSAAPIRRNVFPSHLEPLLKIHGIDRTVLIQAAPTMEETRYILGLADATDFIAKVAGWIDFENPAERKELEPWRSTPNSQVSDP